PVPARLVEGDAAGEAGEARARGVVAVVLAVGPLEVVDGRALEAADLGLAPLHAGDRGPPLEHPRPVAELRPPVHAGDVGRRVEEAELEAVADVAVGGGEEAAEAVRAVGELAEGAGHAEVRQRLD